MTVIFWAIKIAIFLLEKNDKELASLAQSARHSTVVHATGSISLEHDSFHITQVAGSDLSGTTASPPNLATSDIISSRAKIDGKLSCQTNQNPQLT